MENSNLIAFYIVGKYIETNKILLLKLSSINNGWEQRCLNFRGYDNLYISNEKIPDLLEWFKRDFYQYRMFHDQESAENFVNEKKIVDSRKRI